MENMEFQMNDYDRKPDYFAVYAMYILIGQIDFFAGGVTSFS